MATADFDFKPGFNLERCEQHNIESTSRFAAQPMALSRPERIEPSNRMSVSGRGYPQQRLSWFTATDLFGPIGKERWAIKM